MTAVLLAAALMLAGCGGDGDDGSQAAGTTAARDGTTTATASTSGVETEEDAAEDPETDTAAEASAELPGTFAVRVNQLLAKGEFDRAWQLLHPVQRRSFTASELANCWAQVQQFGPDAGYRVTETLREPLPVPGGPPTTQPATTVTLEVVLTREQEGDESESVLATFSQPVHEVDGELRWSVSESLFEAIEDDAC